MKKNLLFAGALTLSFNFAFAVDKVIYGDDNRLDIFEAKNALHLKLAASTAAMIPNHALEDSGEFYQINASTLESDGICPDVRFARQLTAAMCSGFLVGKDLLVTAGHCIETSSDCENNAWVFGYSNDREEKSSFSIPKKDVYRCAKIISRALDSSTENDFALIKLSRETDREPLTYRKSGKVADNAQIVVIGHPSGLPTKISDGAFVRSNSQKYYFQANLDTFGGNSGSAVFDTNTGNVEGILVRGERDYIRDSLKNCSRPKVCKMNECRGEDVTRITVIKELKEM